MRALTEEDLADGLEAGYQCVPIPTQENASGPRICVVARQTPDVAAGYFVLLRDTPQARVVLGALADSAGVIHEWLELWVQNTDIMDSTDPGFRDRLTNATWDAAWRELAADLRALDASSIVANPLEAGHLPPAVLQPETGRFVPLTVPGETAPLTLCRDDQRLKDAGLPTYGGSLARYLHTEAEENTAEPAPAPFIRLRTDSPAGERTTELGGILPDAIDIPSLSVAGAGVIARKFAPLGLEEFCDAAAGVPWRGIENARRPFRVPGVYRLLEDADALRHGDAHLFSAAGGRSARLAEALYLKLQAFTQACRLVRRQVRAGRLPLLNVSAESFRVRLGATGLGLPFLWTARVELARPGQAFALPLGDAGMRHFRSLTPLAESIYRPGYVGLAREGSADALVRRVFSPAEGGIAVEGTLRSSDRLLPKDGHELLTLRLPLTTGRIELYGHIDATQGLSRGEAVFRTVPQAFSEPQAAALRANEGVRLNGIAFSLQPPLSTPFDLYSLGVLALRLLFIETQMSLSESFDAVFSLANEAAQAEDAAEPLAQRIGRLFAAEPRWRERLGPQRILSESDETAAVNDPADLPGALWQDVLALILRFFPGVLPEGFCQGYGDASSLTPETVFDAPIRELDALLLRHRAFLFGGWRQNLEIARIIHAVNESL